ncbi:hypothetical protein [Pantoea sp. VS1]|uniref:hypothetical protein n=1 Tax=Pantoea sp. VS1 TaxID=2003658 RepID=UPI001595C68C|nr:hypothetical protein [Pantoea sp. VS1]
MQVYVEEKKERIEPNTYPCIVLVRDNWDDYDYKTTFYSHVHLSKKEKISIGEVKILTFNQKSGYTKIKPSLPNGLTDEYCSLGSDITYYESIFKLGKDTYEEYLKSLKDVTFDESIERRFNTQEGYKVSLLRFSEVVRMIPDAKKIFKTRSINFLNRKKDSLEFTLTGRPSLTTGENFSLIWCKPTTIDSGSEGLQLQAVTVNHFLLYQGMKSLRVPPRIRHQQVPSHRQTTYKNLLMTVIPAADKWLR